MSTDGIDGYLARLGVHARPAPTLETLVDLQHRHLDTIPYDNLSIMLATITGATPDPVTPEQTLDRVAAGGNAGYCFHHNGLVALVLAEIGYDVVRRPGQMLEATGPSGTLEHLVIEVRGLRADDNPEGRWWPDLGYGDGFRNPLPLVDGHYRQGPFTYRVVRVGEKGWTFHNAPEASSFGSYVRGEVTQDEVDAAHRRLSTPPDGDFTRRLVVQRRDATGADTVRGIRHLRIGRGATERSLREYAEWRAALVGLGLSLAGAGDDELRELHRRMAAGYDDWLAAQ